VSIPPKVCSRFTTNPRRKPHEYWPAAIFSKALQVDPIILLVLYDALYAETLEKAIGIIL